jgi:hypothetical protein
MTHQPQRLNGRIVRLRAVLAFVVAIVALVQFGHHVDRAHAAADFSYPHDWQATTVASSPVSGYDPINVIIIPKGNVTESQLAADLYANSLSWQDVGIGTDIPGAIVGNRCISEEDAAPDPGNATRKKQDFSWRRLNLGCSDPNLILPGNTRNHARGYYQSGSGAWFVTASDEQECTLSNGSPWHCIVPNGFNSGRNGLVNDLRVLASVDGDYSVQLTYMQAYAAGTPPQTDPLGSVSYDGAVAVVTISKLSGSVPAPQLPVSRGAALCIDANYVNCVTYSFDTPYVGGDFNDKFSSVHLIGGQAVSVYQDANYGGRCQIITGDVADLTGSFIGNDQISSIRMGQTCPPAGGARLCTDAGFSGTCVVYTADTSYVGNALNDQFSSILLAPGATISVYQDANYGGRCQIVSSDITNLTGSYIGNDQISSLRMGATCTAVAPASYAAAWSSDSYDGAPLTAITVIGGLQSDQIFIYFRNTGSATWDSNTLLVAWDGSSDAPPGANTSTQFCDPIGPDGLQDWQSCVPGIAAWIGSGRSVAPGQTGLFTFYVQAPGVGAARDYTLYFRPAQRINGQITWINQSNGQRTWDYFTVHVTPNPCPHCQ